MSWATPKIREIPCGMEINMYAEGESDAREDLF